MFLAQAFFCVLCCFAPFTLFAVAPEVYFAPQDRLDEKLISLIEKEKKSIHAAIYCLTHREVIQALIDAKKRSVAVEVLTDPFSLQAKAPLKRLAQAGVLVAVWHPHPKEGQKRGRRKHPLMHDKFCVFGEEKVWTGSFNFTYEASVANQENAVVLHDPAIAARYLAQFRKMRLEDALSFREYVATKKKR